MCYVTEKIVDNKLKCDHENDDGNAVSYILLLFSKSTYIAYIMLLDTYISNGMLTVSLIVVVRASTQKRYVQSYDTNILLIIW